MVKTGIPTQRVSPRDMEMISDDIDISETSNSEKRNWRQNISEGWTMVGTSLIPCGATRPSMSGRVRSLSESAMLSSSSQAVMRGAVGWVERVRARPNATDARPVNVGSREELDPTLYQHDVV